MHGSGNVFRELGRNNADAEQFKAILANEIIQVLDREHLMVRAAHVRTGVAAADFSCIRHADLGRFTADRLTTGPIALTLITLPRTSPTASHTVRQHWSHFQGRILQIVFVLRRDAHQHFPHGALCQSRESLFDIFKRDDAVHLWTTPNGLQPIDDLLPCNLSRLGGVVANCHTAHPDAVEQ